VIAAIYARKSPVAKEVADDAQSVTRAGPCTAFADRKDSTVDDAYVFVDDNISGAEFEAGPGLRLPLVLREPLPQARLRRSGERCVPTRTMRNPSPVSVLRSPSFMKKYTPRCGQSILPLQSESSRLPAILSSSFSRMA
jgi:hypothetical protein